MTNADRTTCNELKETIKNWLQKELSLELSDEKTKITTIKENPINFLGFSIFQNKNQITKIKNKKGITFKRNRNLGPNIGIDMNRILERLKNENIINEKKFPCHCDKYTILKKWQIIEKYNEITRGIYNYYYAEITNKSKLNYIYYLLKYSCYKTIAKREKKSIRQIITENGTEMKTKYTNSNGKETTTKLYTYMEINRWAAKIAIDETKKRIIKIQIDKEKKENENVEKCLTTVRYTHQDPFKTTPANLRSGYKLRNKCSVCGVENSTHNPIQIHHIKHIKKGHISGFNEIMKALNRKTIPCCKTCHIKIHRGKYDGIALKNLVDIDLITA